VTAFHAPSDIDYKAAKLGIHSVFCPFDSHILLTEYFYLLDWAQHGEVIQLINRGRELIISAGICGRGVFLDLVKYYTENGTKPLPYDPWSSHAIPLADLQACAKKEGVEFRQGDILVLRMGFTQVCIFCFEAIGRMLDFFYFRNISMSLRQPEIN
jgi:hypothetical protein